MTSIRHRHITLALIALVALTGAKRVDDDLARYHSKNGRFRVALPLGWVADNTRNSVIVSHDGFRLNSISVARVSLTEAFKTQVKEQKDDGPRAPKAVLAADTSPEDLAAMQIAEAKRANEATALLADDPATVAGFPAFRVTTEVKDERGLRMRSTCYGYIADDSLVRACYAAPSLYYYERDLPAFETLVASIEHVSVNKKKKKAK